MFGSSSPRPVLFVLAIIALSACGAGVGATVSPASPDAIVKSPSMAPARADDSTSASIVYGISDPDLLGESSSAQVQSLEKMKALGISSVRLDASWYWGQPTGPGTFDWAPLDQAVASLQKVGLSGDLDIDQCPPWAALPSAKGSAWAQPASAAAFATWAGAVAARYGSKGVKYFEIWNEPNMQGSWEPKPDPAAYTADLKAAYSAIKGVDPSAIVLSGGLAPAANTSTTYNPLSFLEDMYTDGAKGSFDGVADHPYSYPATPNEFESWSGWSLMSQTSPSLKSIMDENGDSEKKIWITEYGAPTVGADSVGETEQKTDLVQALAQVKDLSWVGSFYIYTWADMPTTASNGFGLLASDNTQKPAYSAVADALRKLG